MILLSLFTIVPLIRLCDSIEVSLKQGDVIGSVEKTIYKKQDYFSFKGIPFAVTPTGELRFQPPKPHNGWEGKYEAVEIKPACMQVNARIRKMVPIGVSGSEDCLYINVFTPDTSGSAPVIVFDYNDNFRASFNSSDTYSPDFFIEEGVVVVTISHRLGLFGYLTTEDKVIPGNAGLRDFILGLEWVKNNIEQFGGNPTKVTLMGNRGGATIAEILLYSEKAKGLFSAAILQSGTAMEALYFYKFPKEKALKLGEVLDINTTDSKILLEELQKIDAKKLIDYEIQATDDDYVRKYQISSLPFGPTIEYGAEDGILTFSPEKGQIVNDVPIIVGFNSREGIDLVSHYIIEPKLLSNKAEESILMFPLRTNIRFDRESSKYKEATKEIIEFYFQDKLVHFGNILEYGVYAQDVLQNYALDVAVSKLLEDLNSPVFYYVFDYNGQFNEISQFLTTRSRFSIEHTGATVGDELCYLLVCSGIRKTYEQMIGLPSEHQELKLVKKMVRLWSNFAKTRNPTPSKEDDILKAFTWEPTRKGDSNYLHITKQLAMKTDPLGDRKKFWDGFLDKYSDLAVDGVVADEIHDEL